MASVSSEDYGIRMMSSLQVRVTVYSSCNRVR